MSEIIFQHVKRNFVSPSGHVMFIYHINTNELPNHFILIVFLCVVIAATVIFSHVKIMIMCYFHM